MGQTFFQKLDDFARKEFLQDIINCLLKDEDFNNEIIEMVNQIKLENGIEDFNDEEK